MNGHQLSSYDQTEKKSLLTASLCSFDSEHSIMENCRFLASKGCTSISHALSKRYYVRQRKGQKNREQNGKLTSNCTKAPGNPFFLSCLILTWQAPNCVNTDFRSSARVSVGTLVDRLG